MPQTIRGKHLRRLRLFENVLDQWIKTNMRIADMWLPHDVPWWYNERALLSVFAAATWWAGGIAYEEFSTEKRGQRKTTPGRMYSGPPRPVY